MMACLATVPRDTIWYSLIEPPDAIRGDRRVVIVSETKSNASPRPLAERTLIGEHPTVVKLRALVDRVAATDATVLITGESGTGKEAHDPYPVGSAQPRLRAGQLRGDST